MSFNTTLCGELQDQHMDVDTVSTQGGPAATAVNRMPGGFYSESVTPAPMGLDAPGRPLTVNMSGSGQRQSTVSLESIVDRPLEYHVTPATGNNSVGSHDLHYSSIAPSEVSNTTTPATNITETEDVHHCFDLFTHMKGYRLLQLISEQSSNGLVDKIIICQDSLRQFINYISPGAYSSLTRIDFSALDKLLINPLGVYGSRSEIARLLLDIEAVDEDTAKLLAIQSTQDSSGLVPTLASGIYIFEAPACLKSAPKFYVVYWPEDITWNDNAPSGIVKNRVTFMRYLTKITDQIIVLLSTEHSAKLDLQKYSSSTTEMEEVDENEDRIFAFSVAKTNEQCEGVTPGPGFKLSHKDIWSTTILDGIPEECSSNLHPILVAGETKQAFLTAMYCPQRDIAKRDTCVMTKAKLESFTRDRSVSLFLSADIPDSSLEILHETPMRECFPFAFHTWYEQYSNAPRTAQVLLQEKLEAFESQHEHKRLELEIALERLVVDKILDLYNDVLKRDDIASEKLLGTDEIQLEKLSNILRDYITLFSGTDDIAIAELKRLRLDDLTKSRFKLLKRNLLIAYQLIKDHLIEDPKEKEILVNAACSENGNALESVLTVATRPGLGQWLIGKVTSFLPLNKLQDTGLISDARTKASPNKISDPDFMRALPRYCEEEPALRQASVMLTQVLRQTLQERIDVYVQKVHRQLYKLEGNQVKAELIRESKIMEENKKRSARIALIGVVNSSYPNLRSGNTLHNIKKRNGYRTSAVELYELILETNTCQPAFIKYTINVLADLTNDDKSELALESGYSHIFRPKFRSQPPSFSLPVQDRIRHIQIFQNNRCLLIISNDAGDHIMFLDDIDRLGVSVLGGRPKVTFSHTKLKSDVIFAVDEGRGLLTLVSSDGNGDCILYVYRLSENFSSVATKGPPIYLQSWHDRPLRITGACFVSGEDEVFLLDGLQGRIYSFTTQQWRPATLTFPHEPSAVFSTPDGSCLFAVFNGICIPQSHGRFYHWDTFGSNTVGTMLELPEPATSFGLTSFAQRNVVHVLLFSSAENCLQSVSLHITRQSSEFKFRSRQEIATGPRNLVRTENNSILDCHSDVWTRFPVLPAINRTTIRSEGREPNWILFVTDDHLHSLFAPYWTNMVSCFEESTKKPVGDALRKYHVTGSHFNPRSEEWCRPSSCFHAGEWLIELICLIPIQICITRDNRLLPLKDGVWSPDVERSLLGADLGQIVESISFGWYESLLHSYYVSKKVKVVSSMGQQSVGKSYMINHLTDCSFQGSAMRTTEGCWMSLTPTDEYLIVSLDFEGLDSIERSAQEDTLLVLFNAAISNLVLFRNNFALSREITTSFQSFQSSSQVLNPTVNPTLFQGLLAIVVKDVIDADSAEIVREFSEKLQHIVSKEQDSNFMTRLHKGEVMILPWPVIESQKFYSMFHRLKKVLYSRPVTHPGAGVFLSTLKTLMAKLKTNDWGALDQNLGTLRAQMLDAMLSSALVYGMSDVGTEQPLTDIDNDTVIPSDDSRAILYLSGCAESINQCSDRLKLLRQAFYTDYKREDPLWMSELSTYLNTVVGARIRHVESWLEINSQRFASNADIAALQRRFDDLVWAIEGREDAVLEVDGHRYAANDSGAPFLCNLVCFALGRRHMHLDYCRAEGTVCENPQSSHINSRMLPYPDKPKDFVTHELFWERTGFKDPYTREEQADFAKCDHFCRDPEHEATATTPAQPSYCTLPMFHAPQLLSQPSSAQGYVSSDGHDFICRNPSVGHQAFHVIFVIDRSSSMSSRDRLPDRASTGGARIYAQGYTNRLGAVYSALYSFWTAREANMNNLADRGGTTPRRDAYSVILFDNQANCIPVLNDFVSSADGLLDAILPYGPQGGTNFNAAINVAHGVLKEYWSDERSPVVIFLSDGECSVSDATIDSIARKSLSLGKPVTFHSVSFGPNASSYYLRRMADIAGQIYATAPQELAAPGGGCSYTEAIDTIRLAETFLGFAASMQKPRGSLLKTNG
ncbi:hypothetical protein BU17DRAFT_100044 [Hysterangium stoloniferum]|nr:hypothetical protein BU17DRAFT_100044 [Hysterangium stoloniferum]